MNDTEAVSNVTRRRILVLGLGISGAAAARQALRLGGAVTVLDAARTAMLETRAAALEAEGAEVRLGWSAPAWDGPAPALAVMSPGIAPESVLGRLAAGLACPVVSELEFGFRHLACPVLAITGTNGKTTTTELLTACLAAAGKRVCAAGNIGDPLCDAVPLSGGLDFLVVEVSSFQLETIDTFAPLAAAVLNITPDHLDRYGGMGPYAAAKARLFRRMPRADHVVMRPDVLDVAEIRRALPADGSRPVFFSLNDVAAARYVVRGADGMLCRRAAPGGALEELMPAGELQLKGGHNLENVMAVIALAELAGVPFAAIRPALAQFAPSRHRMELAAEAGGVRYINDSKATNPDAVVRAIETLAPPPPGRILLIAGGLDKGLEFSLLRPLLARHVRQVGVIGKCADSLVNQWQDIVYCKKFLSLEAAVDDAVANARPGDTVLLAPGCASMDMFSSYAERGSLFCDLVKRKVTP